MDKNEPSFCLICTNKCTICEQHTDKRVCDICMKERQKKGNDKKRKRIEERRYNIAKRLRKYSARCKDIGNSLGNVTSGKVGYMHILLEVVLDAADIDEVHKWACAHPNEFEPINFSNRYDTRRFVAHFVHSCHSYLPCLISAVHRKQKTLFESFTEELYSRNIKLLSRCYFIFLLA